MSCRNPFPGPAIFAGAFLLAVVQTMADPPRERLSLDSNWCFHLGDASEAGNRLDYPEVSDLPKTRVDEMGLEGSLANLSDAVTQNVGAEISFVKNDFDDRDWRQLDLPHDWAVELPFDERSDVKHGFKPVGQGFPQNSIGWYRRQLDLPAGDSGKTLWLEFDGVYRNSLVWVNGHCLGRHLDGYSSFRYDITKFANCGGTNEIVVRVDASRFEGWFYEGAGIYRHVWLEKTLPQAIAPDGIFVWSEFQNNQPKGICEVHIQTQLLNPQTNTVVKCEIITPAGKSLGQAHHVVDTHGKAESKFDFCPPNEPLGRAMAIGDVAPFHVPVLWSPENPELYKLITTVEKSGKLVDRKETDFGIRTVAFDATNGFLLNGRRYQVQGACNHQDHAGVGVALPDALQDFRVRKLKEMGCNAIRTSHNPPAPELLDACDRLGLLVMDETRRMDTNDFALGELKSLILRDRNHPSVFIWSLGNEEFYLQGTKGTNEKLTAAGAQAAAVSVITPMQTLAHSLDPTRLCTVAMNGGWGHGFSSVIDVQGFNYRTREIDGFHENFPGKLTIGTETASTRVTRGIYVDDKAHGYVAAYGSNGVERAQQWWPYYAAHPFTSGGFVWTGFDYRGEPTPYKWPCISSHFGLMDTCGFPKDICYYYQSWWTDKPVLHIMPHWNWPDLLGKEIPVRVFSNCKEVELFLNGQSLGKRPMQPDSCLDWDVVYQPGVLSAKGFDENGNLVLETKIETTGAPAAIRLSPDRTTVNANGEDLSIVDVSVVDKNSRLVPVANNLIHFELSGPGKIIGVGNGDPSCHEPDKCAGQWQRSAFNGCAQVIVQTTRNLGTIQLTATSPGVQTAALKITSKTAPRPSPFGWGISE